MKNKDIRKNASGYSDPTAYEAILHADTELERHHRLIRAIRDICELSDFHIEGRIILKDKRTGKVWR